MPGKTEGKRRGWQRMKWLGHLHSEHELGQTLEDSEGWG